VILKRDMRAFGIACPDILSYPSSVSPFPSSLSRYTILSRIHLILLFAIRMVLFARRVFKRLLDERLSILKSIEAVDSKFNIADAPVSDLRDISGKRD